MRRLIGAAALVALAATAMSAHAGSVRREIGIVIAPVPMQEGRPLAEIARCAPPAIEDHGAFGSVIELLPGEGDGAHMFSLLDAEMGFTPPPADFDITFYTDIGSCDPASFRMPAPSDPPVFDGPYNEQGMIPLGMRYAVVTTKDGIEVPFELRIVS